MQTKSLSSELRSITKIASPLVVAMLASIGVEVTDTFMMGRLGPTALAAGALGGAVYLWLLVFAIGINAAVSILCSHAIGEKRSRDVAQIVQHGLGLSIFLGILLAIFVLFVPRFFLLIGQPESVIDKTTPYLRGLSWGLPGLMGYFAIKETATALAKPHLTMIINILILPVNAIGDYMLMYGKFGLPTLGIGGIGIATSIVNWGGFLCLFFLLVRNSKIKPFHITRFTRFDWSLIRNLFRLGLPMGILNIFECGLFSVTSLLMGYFGETSLAANQVSLQLASASFMIPLGVAQAVTVRMGYAMGAQSPVQMRHVKNAGLLLGLVIACVIALFLYAGRYPLSHFFVDADISGAKKVITLSAQFLVFVAILQFGDVFQAISLGALRGMKDTIAPMLMGVLSFWGVGLGSGYFFGFVFNWKGIGLWAGITLGVTVTAMLLLSRLYYQFSKKTT